MILILAAIAWLLVLSLVVVLCLAARRGDVERGAYALARSGRAQARRAGEQAPARNVTGRPAAWEPVLEIAVHAGPRTSGSRPDAFRDSIPPRIRQDGVAA